MIHGIFRRLSTRTQLALVLAFGVALLWPALRTPFFLDDYLHSAMVRGAFPTSRSPLDLYSFVDDGNRAALLQKGLLPWWSHPNITIRFFRPLSSALLYADHSAFGAHPFPMHVHSLVWWVLAVLSARALFTRVLAKPRAQLIATIIFAFSACHAVPVAWLANRETLVSLVFGAFALVAYARFRSDRRARDAIAAFVLFTLALASGGEYALCFAGYVVAIDLTRPRDSIAARVVGWIPFAIPAIAYLAIRSKLHYGSSGSGFYSDPLSDPTRFLSSAPQRFVALFLDTWLTIDTGNWFATWQKIAAWMIALACVIAGAIVVRRTLSARESNERASLRWMWIGSFLSLGPVLAVVPSMRLCGIAMLGVAPVVAAVLDQAWFVDRRAPASSESTWGSLFVTLVGFLHLVHSPAALWLDGSQIEHDARELAARADTIEGRTGGNASRANIGIVRGGATMYFAPFALEKMGALPAHWWVLTQSNHVLVLRDDDRTIELVSAKGRSLFPAGELNLYRSEEPALEVGTELTVPGIHATILEVGERGPSRARLRFDDPPDEIRWFTDDHDAMREVVLPRAGLGTPFDP